MATESQRLADGSTLVGLVCATATRLQAWVTASWLASATATLTSTLDTATRTAALSRTLQTLADYTRHSFCYRWLTKEPEPNVVVINLRETYAVGPIITLLDRTAPVFGRACRESRASDIFDVLQTTAIGAWISDSRTVQLVAAALEPPEPLDEDRRG